MKWILPSKSNATTLFDQLLQNREIIDIDRFLNPKDDQIYDPFLLYGMEDAVKVLKNAITTRKKIFIHGDFDVDGITATSIMWDFLYNVAKADVLPYIPNRFDQGYGLSESSIEEIINQGGKLIITVDCGIKDIDLVNKYKNKVDFIITDHHTLQEVDNESKELLKNDSKYKIVNGYVISADALAVVHPKLNPEYPFTEISGAVVSWKVCLALNKYLGTDADMSRYIELAALGTVCDIMPLIDENRAIVSLGLNGMRQTQNKGIRALLDVSGVNVSSLDSYHFGFVIGPRLNASGRLKSALDAVHLLTTNSSTYAREIATNLNVLNQKRQQITKELLDLAEAQVSEEIDNKILVTYGKDWPEGIVGLIAGRLTEKYSRPALVGSLKNDLIKGSARSTTTFNIARALKESSHLLERYGGHAQAAGFSVLESNMPDFKSFIQNLASTSLMEDSLEKTLKIDGIIDISTLSVELVKNLNKLAPFGLGNPTPVFALMNVKPIRVQTLGKLNNHMKFFVKSGSYGILECITFNFKDQINSAIDLTNLLSDQLFDVAGTLEVDQWNGDERIVMKVKDIRISD
jgi:single-stranded-DNA-specific exonuclease